MEKPLLTNPEIIPERDVFEYALANAFPAFETLMANIAEPENGLSHEWRYYNDGKCWLCKAQFRKKTVFWLSIWDAQFKVTFYFMEKHLDDLFELPIAQDLKEQLNQAKPTNKFFPITSSVQNLSQLGDVLTLVAYKKKNL